MPSRLKEHADARVWDLGGLTVIQIIVDPAQIRLVIASGYVGDADELSVVVENDFTIREDAVTYTVAPDVTESLAPILGLRMRPTASLTAGRDGSLALRFTNGAELLVARHEVYESWHTFGRGAFAEAGMLCSAHDGAPWIERPETGPSRP